MISIQNDFFLLFLYISRGINASGVRQCFAKEILLASGPRNLPQSDIHTGICIYWLRLIEYLWSIYENVRESFIKTIFQKRKQTFVVSIRCPIISHISWISYMCICMRVCVWVCMYICVRVFCSLICLNYGHIRQKAICVRASRQRHFGIVQTYERIVK